MATELAPFPLHDARAHLALLLARVGACLERRRSVRDGSDERRWAAEHRIAAIDAELEARRAVSTPSHLPVAQLQRRFDLGDAAVRFLVAAAAPGLDLELGRAMAESSEESRRQPDLGFLLELVTSGPDERRILFAELGDDAPLVRYRLIRLGPPRGWVPEGPILLAPVAVPERVIGWLRGHTHFDGHRFYQSARLVRGAEGAELDGDTRAALDRVLFRTDGARRLSTVVVGPSLAGKRTAVLFAAELRGAPVLDVDLEALVLAPDPADALQDILREACLHDAVLLCRHAEPLLEERFALLRRAVATVMGDGRIWVVLTTRGEPGDFLRLVPGSQPLHLTIPGEIEQVRLWQSALPSSAARARDLDPEVLVERYHLTPGDIREAAARAITVAASRGPTAPLTLADITDAVRGRLRHRLKDVADVITTTLDWSHIVLPDDVIDRIAELISTVHHAKTVMDEWGFGQRVSYGRALSALFSGPPGTGKTMVAGLIAKELGLELFRVDLSRVVSKWVGETEKNLGLAFDEARNARAILLFDEADSLFGKRTEVKSANDRYANLETNYLLQRIESFDGVVLLTTNREPQMDEAFRRRLRFRIVFPTPDEYQREQLWRAMIPPGAPLADDIDFSSLAARFAMSGGYIKNAVMRAAYMAAGTPERLISDALLVRAASLEWQEMGKLE